MRRSLSLRSSSGPEKEGSSFANVARVCPDAKISKHSAATGVFSQTASCNGRQTPKQPSMRATRKALKCEHMSCAEHLAIPRLDQHQIPQPCTNLSRITRALERDEWHGRMGWPALSCHELASRRVWAGRCDPAPRLRACWRPQVPPACVTRGWASNRHVHGRARQYPNACTRQPQSSPAPRPSRKSAPLANLCTSSLHMGELTLSTQIQKRCRAPACLKLQSRVVVYPRR